MANFFDKYDETNINCKGDLCAYIASGKPLKQISESLQTRLTKARKEITREEAIMKQKKVEEKKKQLEEERRRKIHEHHLRVEELKQRKEMKSNPVDINVELIASLEDLKVSIE